MKILKSSIIIFFLCIGVALISDYGTIRDIFQVPPGKVSVLGHNAYADYYFYLSMIGEGTRGKLQQTSRYTTEQFPEKFAQPFFLLVGNIGGLFGLEPYQIYWVSRIVFSSLLLFLIYSSGKMLFGSVKRGLLTLFTVLMSVPLWYWSGERFETYCGWWTGFDPIYRITFLPHHMAANCMGLLTLLLVERGIRGKRMGWLVGSLPIMVLGICFNPAILLIYLGALFFGGTWLFIRKKATPTLIVFGVVAGIVVTATYAYLYTIYSSTFPWTTVSEIEKKLYYPLDLLQFLYVLGPMALVAVAGIFCLKRWSFLFVAVIAWFFIPIVALLLFPFLPSSLPLVIIRFVQSAPFIPVGILASACVLFLWRFVKKQSTVVRIIGTVILVIFYMLSIPSFVASVVMQDVDFRFYHEREVGFYVPKDQMEILKWLHTNAEPDSVVLSPEPLPYMIPAFTHARVPYGNAWNTYDAEKKTINGYHMFTYRLDEKNRVYIEKERISYLITLQTEIPPEAFLQEFGFGEVFENASLRVYKRNINE